MRVRLALAFSLALLFQRAALAETPIAEPERAFARALLAAGETVYVGQLVRFYLEVGADTWLATAPPSPELRLAGAIAVALPGSATPFSRSEDGRTLSGTRRAYAVFPLRSGTLEIPPIALEVQVANAGASPTAVAVSTDPLRLQVEQPAGTSGSRLLTTPNLKLSQSFDRELSGLRVEDSLTRSVRIEAEQTLGLMLPDLAFVAPDGIAVYPAQPQVADETQRGRVHGTRVESVTYVVERMGWYTLPELRVSWWNPETATLEIAVLPSLRFFATATPAQIAGTLLAAVRASPEAAVAWLVIAYLAVRFGKRGVTRLLALWRERRARAAESERHYFRAFRRACRGASESETVAAFWHWLDRLPGSDTRPTTAQLVRVSDEAEVTWLRDAQTRRYGRAEKDPASLRDFAKRVAPARRRLLRSRSRAGDPWSLNP